MTENNGKDLKIEQNKEGEKRKTRNDKGRVIIGKRDVEIMSMVKKFGSVTEGQIIKMFNFGKVQHVNNCRRILGRLEKSGYIKREPFLYRGNFYIWFTTKGVKFFGGKVNPPRLLTLRHDTFVVDFAIQKIKNGVRMEDIMTEVESIRDQDFGQKKRVLPDLIIGSTAYEIEISEKSSLRLREIIGKHQANKDIEKTVYITDRISIARRIREISSKVEVMLFTGDDLRNIRIYETEKETSLPAQSQQKTATERVAEWLKNPK